MPETITFKEAREKVGIKADFVAKKMGMSRAAYSMKENYERQFKDVELLRFCDVVGCDVHELKIKGYNY